MVVRLKTPYNSLVQETLVFSALRNHISDILYDMQSPVCGLRQTYQTIILY